MDLDNEFETTGLFSVIKDEDYLSIGEKLEELEEKVEYMNITDEEKNKINKLIADIRKEDNDKTKEFLFKLLIKEFK